MVRAWYQSGTKPSRASAMAGAITSGRSMVPYRSSARESPAIEPGTATERWPTMLASSATLRQGKRSEATPSASGYTVS